MDAFLKHIGNGDLLPANKETEDYIKRRKVGEILKCKITRARNYQFHKKAMALVRTVHDAMPEPEPIMHKGKIIEPIRSFDDTREYLTILAGEYDVVGLPDGRVQLKAKSWAFENMDADEFENFYSRLIDACLKALPDTWSKEYLEEVANEVIGFV